MKKLLYTLVLISFMGIASADYDFSQAVKTTPMPTDAEIRATISRFNFDDNQKEIIFRETKMKLRELYSKSDAEINEELNQNYRMMNSVSGDYLKDSTREQTKNRIKRLPQRKSTPQYDDGYTYIK